MQTLYKSKLIHHTFRVEDFVLASLEEEARKKSLSVSNLVNRILRQYITSEVYFQELGYLPVAREFLRAYTSKLEEKDLIAIGRSLGSTIAKEHIAYLFGPVNTASLIPFLELWFSKFRSYQHRTNGRSHWFSVNHDINMNFSIYAKEFLTELIQSIIAGPVKFTLITPSGITFTFDD
jgi:hypothetical protein